jgi:cytochrome c oxidase cbb3-type subunit III
MAQVKILGAAFWLTAAVAFSHPAMAADDAKLKASAHLYDTYCAQCHGVNRDGKGVNTVGLSVQPRDHSDTKGMTSIPLEEMTKAIRDGGASVNKSALMPPWSSVLTDEQITDMVAYRMSLRYASVIQKSSGE